MTMTVANGGEEKQEHDVKQEAEEKDNTMMQVDPPPPAAPGIQQMTRQNPMPTAMANRMGEPQGGCYAVSEAPGRQYFFLTREANAAGAVPTMRACPAGSVGAASRQAATKSSTVGGAQAPATASRSFASSVSS